MKSLFWGDVDKFLTLSIQSLTPDPSSSSELCQIWDVTPTLYWTSWNCTIKKVFSQQFSGMWSTAKFMQGYLGLLCLSRKGKVCPGKKTWLWRLCAGCKCSAQTSPVSEWGETRMMGFAIKYICFTTEHLLSLLKSIICNWMWMEGVQMKVLLVYLSCIYQLSTSRGLQFLKWM